MLRKKGEYTYHLYLICREIPRFKGAYIAYGTLVYAYTSSSIVLTDGAAAEERVFFLGGSEDAPRFDLFALLPVVALPDFLFVPVPEPPFVTDPFFAAFRGAIWKDLQSGGREGIQRTIKSTGNLITTKSKLNTRNVQNLST